MLGLTKWIRKPTATPEAGLREELRLALLGWEEEQAAHDKQEAEVKRLRRELERATQQINNQEVAYQTVSAERDNLKKLVDNTSKELKTVKDRNEFLDQQYDLTREKLRKYEDKFNSFVTQIEEVL